MEFCHEEIIWKAIICLNKSVKTIPITPSLSKHFLHVPTNLRRACCVLYLSLNPHDRFDNFGLMNSNICEYISLSNIFDRVDAGVTSDLFTLLGKVFISNDLLVCRVIST